jgi:hypothetical protein
MDKQMGELRVLRLCVILAMASVGACGGGSSRGGGDDGDVLDAGMPDPGCTIQKFYPDVDGDHFGDSTKGVNACTAPTGFIAQGGDCRDDSPAIHPGAKEVCDQVDNDCNALTDDADPGLDLTTATTYYRDGDGDGFGDPAMSRAACTAPAGYVASSTDCNDANAAVNPGATEVCDDIDNNCNGLVDQADPDIDLTTAHAFYKDVDLDGFGAGAPVTACSAPAGFVDVNGDCNDDDSTSHPGGTEVCDGRDNDCDGGIDGTAAAPNRCAALVGTYGGAYMHQATEHIGSTIINQVRCNVTAR